MKEIVLIFRNITVFAVFLLL